LGFLDSYATFSRNRMAPSKAFTEVKGKDKKFVDKDEKKKDEQKVEAKADSKDTEEEEEKKEAPPVNIGWDSHKAVVSLSELFA